MNIRVLGYDLVLYQHNERVFYIRYNRTKHELRLTSADCKLNTFVISLSDGNSRPYD